MNIHLATVVGSHVELLPHMLSHYRSMGIRSMLVNVHLDRYDDPLYRTASEIASRYGAEISSVYTGRWLRDVNTFLYRQTQLLHLNDWFILADLDEFQVYPRDIWSLVADMDRQGYDYVEGCVIDRVARDGGLPAIVKDIPIWEQFPLAGLVTYPLLGANILKVVAARGSVRLAHGQHSAYNGRGCPREQEYIPVHHFKWSTGLVDRLKDRVEFYKAHDEPIWAESQRFIDYSIQHNGKIDVADPRMLFAESTTEYPLWQRLKHVVLSRAPRSHNSMNVENAVR